MGVSFGRSRVADLNFQVFARAIHPDWFAMRAHRRFTQDAWEADVRIIEGGHAITFRFGEVRLTEVLAGPETLLPEPGLLFHSSVRHERSTMLEPQGGVSYQACFEVERVDPEVFSHLCEEVTLDASRGGLFHRFSPLSRLSPAPISHILVESRMSRLSVQTFHTFPEEHAIVRTQSLFEPKGVLHPHS
ncbi:DUF2617 family protein [Singulisphaera sp. PoT]|uniref:DUF2617 family protein n=1 Tax=Singulisphaera sp. PoT TaxID=3411797 RepID=UPI003BF47A59